LFSLFALAWFDLAAIVVATCFRESAKSFFYAAILAIIRSILDCRFSSTTSLVALGGAAVGFRGYVGASAFFGLLGGVRRGARARARPFAAGLAFSRVRPVLASSQCTSISSSNSYKSTSHKSCGVFDFISATSCSFVVA
jgi:hypothetical protein